MVGPGGRKQKNQKCCHGAAASLSIPVSTTEVETNNKKERDDMFTRIKKNILAVALVLPALALILLGGAYALDASTQPASRVAATDTIAPLPGDRAESLELMVPCCFQCDSVCDTYGEFSTNCIRCQNACIDCAAPGDESTSEPDGEGTQRACATGAAY
jgi:hypothetical protein